MSYRFENLEVWQEARKYVSAIYGLSEIFPNQEQFGLTNQIRRAAVSVVLNIAEGSDRKSDIEFCRFLRISLTSINEVVTGLYIAKDQDYLHQEEFDKIYEQSNILSAKLNALINSLNGSQ